MVEYLPIVRSTLSLHLGELREVGLIKGEINLPKIRCIAFGMRTGLKRKGFLPASLKIKSSNNLIT